jgi:hypothetical protein
MMKSVQADHSIEQYLTQSTVATLSTGILIGSADESRVVLYSCIPTPNDPNAEHKNSAQWSAEGTSWILSHAIQVSRMLTGALKVLGLYSIINNSAANKSTLENELKACLHNLPINNSERYLFTSINTKLITEYYAGNKPNSVKSKPITVKFSKIHGSNAVYTFQTQFSIDTQLIALLKSPSHIAQSINEGLDYYYSAINNCRTLLINGETLNKDQFSLSLDKLYSGDGNSAKHKKNKGKNKKNKLEIKENSDSSNLIEVDFFCPHNDINSLSLAQFSQLQQANQSVVDEKMSETQLWKVNYRGTIVSRAVVHEKFSVNFAIEQLKLDVISSLKARIEMFIEELQYGGQDNIEKDQKDLLQELLSKESLILPRRVIIEKQGLSFCDYAQSFETQQDSVSRFEQLLAIKDIDEKSNIITEKEAEHIPPTPSESSNNNNHNSASSTSQSRNGHVVDRAEVEKLKSQSTSAPVIIAFLAVIVAITAAFAGQLGLY